MSGILDVLPAILQTVSKVTGLSNVGDVVNALTGNTLPPEQKVALQQAMLEHENALAQINADQFKSVLTESLAEINSEDNYVKRARPTGLYVGYAVVAFLAALQGFLLAKAVLHNPPFSPTWLDTGTMTTILTPLFGTGGLYMWLRTKEKTTSNGAGGGSQ